MDVTRLAPLLAERGFRVDVALRKATLAEIKRRRTQLATDLGFNPASLPQLKAALKALKLPARANLRTEALESLRPYDGSGTVDAVLEWRRLALVRADLLALKGAWVTALLSTTDNAAGYPVARAADHIAHSVNLHRLCPEAWECLEATEGWALERVPVAPSALTVLADLVGDPTLLTETTPGAVELCYAYGPQQFSALINADPDLNPVATFQNNDRLDFLGRHQSVTTWWKATEVAILCGASLTAPGGRVARFWPRLTDGAVDAPTLTAALRWQVEARQADAAVAGLLAAHDAETSQRRVLTLHGLNVVWEVAPDAAC